MCEIYGLSENPLKEWMQGTSFQKENAFIDCEHLPENLVKYLSSNL